MLILQQTQQQSLTAQLILQLTAPLLTAQQLLQTAQQLQQTALSNLSSTN